MTNRTPLNEKQLVQAVRRTMDVDGTEEEIDALIADVSRSVPHPSWTDLIYYNDRQLSAQEVVEQALAYKPIQLRE